MTPSARESEALFPPVRRQRRSISVIPKSWTSRGADEGIIFVVKPLHKRSHSIAADAFRNYGKVIDEDFRFLFESSTSLMDFASEMAPAEDRGVQLFSGSFKENEVSTVNEVAFKLSWAIVNGDIDFQDCSPKTPKSQLSCMMTNRSPPALRKPSYVYVDVSPPIDSDLLLPDCF